MGACRMRSEMAACQHTPVLVQAEGHRVMHCTADLKEGAEAICSDGSETLGEGNQDACELCSVPGLIRMLASEADGAYTPAPMTCRLPILMQLPSL